MDDGNIFPSWMLRLIPGLCMILAFEETLKEMIF